MSRMTLTGHFIEPKNITPNLPVKNSRTTRDVKALKKVIILEN